VVWQQGRGDPENEWVLADGRMLGTGDFVQSVIEEAEERIKYQLRDNDRRKKAQELIEQTCKEENVNLNELTMGDRRGRIAAVRMRIANELVEKYAFPSAEVARQPGVATSAVSKAIGRLSKNVIQHSQQRPLHTPGSICSSSSFLNPYNNSHGGRS